MSRNRLVFVCTEVGVGHLLSALLHSAYYAFKTDRALAIDMRRCFYFQKNKHEQFLDHFACEFPKSMDIITDLREVDRLVSKPGARMVVQGDRLDIERPFDDEVVVVPCYTPGEPFTVERGRADGPFRITLKGALADRWEEAKKKAEWPGKAIGMHFRSMKGEFVERMNQYVIPDFNVRINTIRDRYIETATRLAETLGLEDPAYFVASDDGGFIDYMKAGLRRVVTSGSQIPTRPGQSWADHVAENNFDLSILSDAVNDMWFLGECDAIVRSPHSAYSKFSILNSNRISKSQIIDIPVPTCAEIFASIEPEVAVNWTRVALRDAQARRIRDNYPYQWHVEALERAERENEAKYVRQRATWQWEAIHSAAANMPGEHWDPSDIRGEKLDAAIAIVSSIAERLPVNPYVLAGYRPHSLAHLLCEAGRLDDALKVARKAIDIDPDDAYLHQHLAKLLMTGNYQEEAEKAFRRALALVLDDGELFGEYAQCLKQLARVPEAVRMLRVAIALKPDRLQWRIELSRIFLDVGLTDQAKAALLDGLSADARKSEVLGALSIVLEVAGKQQEAISAIEEACEIEPHFLRWKYRLGELALAVGDHDLAFRTYNQIVQITSSSAHANHALSMVCQRQGKLEEALDAARRASAIEPNAPHRLARVGEVLLQCSKLDEARETLRSAIDMGDDSPETAILLSNVLEQLEMLPDAFAAAQRAAKVAPYDQRWRERLSYLSGRIEQPDRSSFS